MSLFLGDIRLRAMIELGLEDISKNDWLLNDILGDTISNPYLRERYGNQIASCKEWLANNRINIFLSEQQADRLEFPAVVIELGPSNEKPEMKHMADFSVEYDTLIPNTINKPIPYVLNPTAGSYNSMTGVFSFNSNVNLNAVSEGMVLVFPQNGVGYIVQGVTQANQVNLLTGLDIPAGNYGIVPKYQVYQSKVGHTFMNESYRVTCHANDQQTLLWLHSIIVYSLLRYRQVLLEKDGYAESLINSGKIYPNGDYSDAGQIIWSRDIEITGQVENRWIIQPHRFIENVAYGNANGYEGGIKIISNLNDIADPNLNEVNWSTLAAIAEAGDN